jgi:hypothetical protein
MFTTRRKRTQNKRVITASDTPQEEDTIEVSQICFLIDFNLD